VGWPALGAGLAVLGVGLAVLGESPRAMGTTLSVGAFAVSSYPVLAPANPGRRAPGYGPVCAHPHGRFG
jgi:hypothetical protein